MATTTTAPPSLLALQAGARLAEARLACRRFVLAALFAITLAAMVALVERSHEPVGAASRMLTVVFGLVVPLSSFAVLAVVTGRARLAEAAWPLSRHGLRGSHVALGLLLTAQVAAALLAMVVVAVALVLSHGLSGPAAGAIGLGRDVLVSGWIAAAGAAAYVAWFGLGATFLRFGRGRWVVLAADFLLGLGTGYLAACWPRAHLGNLIGAEPVLELPQTMSSGAVAAMIVVPTLAAALRAGD